MAMPTHTSPIRRWTLEEFYEARDAAPKSVRYEFVDGEILVTPSPHWTHQRIASQLFSLLNDYVRAHDVGEVFTPPLDVNLEPNLVLQPDILVVPRGLLRKRSDVVNRLLLAGEVISPSSARHDRVRKRPAYQRNRVPEYWIIDDRAQIVERWRPDDDRPEIVLEQLEWRPQGASEPFVLDLQRFFAELLPADDEPRS
jgi:Uma2 family endonuclease